MASSDPRRRVDVELRGHTAYVRLSRPDKLNGLDLPMLDQLIATAQRLHGDRSRRAVILLGDGPAFSAGLDFASVSKHPARLAQAFARLPWRPTNRIQQVAWAWRMLPIPVIAVLHGHCYGGALQLALAADFRYATPDCKLAVLEAKWGLIPDMTGTVTLRELVGADVAKRLTMTGETFDATYAERIGLVTATADDPLGEAEALVELLSTRSPDAVAAAKALLNRTRSLGVRAALHTERVIQLRLLLGRNSAIARKAGLSGKRPEFERRRFG